MNGTPKYLLNALDMVTARRSPSAAAVGKVESLHAGRVRDAFEDPNIVAIGISEKVTEKKATGTLSLTFYVERKIPRSKVKPGALIPPVVAVRDDRAVFTDVKAIGIIAPQVRRKARPIQSGFSVGHVDTTAGTIGAIVKKGGKYYVLSNSHVLAQSGLAKKGDLVLYPGSADDGTVPKHVIGKLARFVPFRQGDDYLNHVDAALAEIAKSRLTDLDFSILGLQGPARTIAPQRGMKVVKRGRTTGETEGVIQDVNFRLIIDYEGVGKVGFLDQVLCTRYTKPGDSGSLVVDKGSGKIVGLHFAGASGGSVFSPIAATIDALGFTFASA